MRDVIINVPEIRIPDIHLPEIRVDAPVTVEAARAPEVTAHIEVNPTPVHVDAPAVTVEATEIRVDAPVTVSPVVTAPPAPDVHITVEAPEPTPRNRRVLRDSKGNIERVVEE